MVGLRLFLKPMEIFFCIRNVIENGGIRIMARMEPESKGFNYYFYFHNQRKVVAIIRNGVSFSANLVSCGNKFLALELSFLYMFI